jgi:hypothetical protein
MQSFAIRCVGCFPFWSELSGKAAGFIGQSHRFTQIYVWKSATSGILLLQPFLYGLYFGRLFIDFIEGIRAQSRCLRVSGNIDMH